MNNRQKILFVSANPSDSQLQNIDWGYELKALDKIFRKGKLKNAYVLETLPHIEPAEFINSLKDENPWLLHFCGHGDSSGSLILETSERNKFTLQKKDFLKCLSEQTTLKCLILCSCNSDKVLEEAQDFVEYCIGFTGELINEDSIHFAKIFYKNFNSCESLPNAFQRTIDELKVTPYQCKGQLLPIFKSKNSYVMKNIIVEKNLTLRSELSNEKLLEVQELEKTVENVEEDIRPLLMQLIDDNPFADGVFWFYEKP